ncbi:Alginate lyase [Zhongshania aliphaticivorans]|uniref:Alginate lyase n=1 Tax=Zhongshania aliphaticivorans TaxID=1470434 RepID=A0A5S9N4Z7_9GAMM|nr:polysaccharide lyase family 7 protein [Zhongshania aliphaticivorans]CAA0082813.1 Alginate lyase [Zhongshania aliphaticivorans]CAA0083975.1 Alginate lyase [Zhongshania aliphaticivorans]
MKFIVTIYRLKIAFIAALFLNGCGEQVGIRPSEKALVPADKFDLSSWKITIPTDSNNDGKVDEISVSEIQTYQHPDFFYLNADGNMVFAAPNKAFTTPNSTNTRSELHHVIASTADQEKGIAHNFALKSHKRADEFSQIGGNLQATVMVNHVAKRATYPEKNPAFSVVVGQIHGAKDQALVAEGEGYGWGNEPLKIYYKKWPDHKFGSVFWNYERNLEKDNPARQDISYLVWGKSWDDAEDPGEAGIALDEAFSYEVNVNGNIMDLTFTTERHGTVKYQINLADNVDAYGNVDELDHPNGYSGDAHFFKAGAYNQCSIKDAPGMWYPKCLGTGDWATDKANGDYAQVTFLRLLTGPAKSLEL